MAEALISVELGAAGRPILSYLIEKATSKLHAKEKHRSINQTTTPQPPAHETSNLARVPEESIGLLYCHQNKFFLGPPFSSAQLRTW